MYFSEPQGSHQKQSEAVSFDHWCFPCICCLAGLNCYNVTSGSAICNNVTRSSAMQVCKHGFTNLVSNVMTTWYFQSYNHQCFHVQIKFNMAHEIFQWLPLIFNDFSRQYSIFPGEHKIQWLFKSRVKFHDFSRPVRTMIESFILWHAWRYSGVLWVNSYQLVLHSQTPPGSHAWVSRHCYPIGCVIKSTHRGICSCSPIVNVLEVTFYHGMVISVIFLIKN